MNDNTHLSEEEGTLPKEREELTRVGHNPLLPFLSDKKIIYIMSGLFLLMAILLMFSFNESNKCMSNPLIYGAEKLSSETTGDVGCTCYFDSPNYAPFRFDKESIGAIDFPSF